jgi:hypothetical protein
MKPTEGQMSHDTVPLMPIDLMTGRWQIGSTAPTLYLSSTPTLPISPTVLHPQFL